jgi:WD40 repeat protein
MDTAVSYCLRFEHSTWGRRWLTIRGNQPESNFVESAHTSAHTGPCFTLSWSEGGLSAEQGGKGILASGGADGRIIVWQIVAKDGGDLAIYPVGAVRHAHGDGDVNGLQWCLREDGKGKGMLASAGDDGSVKVWRFVDEA